MMCGLVNVSFSLPEWQAVKMTFFAPWGNYLTLTDVRLKDEYVVVQFYPWLIHFTSLCFWGMVMDDNEFETKENKI